MEHVLVYGRSHHATKKKSQLQKVEQFVYFILQTLRAETFLIARRRFCIVSIAISELSMPIHLLPKVSAATRDVPEPAKQSRIISSGFEEA